MQYFNFSRLINKYKSEFTAITQTDGAWNARGVWESGSKEVTMTGAIISQSENKIFRSEGTLTEKDKQLYMLKPIDELIGSKVIYKGNTYELTACVDNAEFTGVYAYTLKYISAFNEEGGGNND